MTDAHDIEFNLVEAIRNLFNEGGGHGWTAEALSRRLETDSSEVEPELNGLVDNGDLELRGGCYFKKEKCIRDPAEGLSDYYSLF